MLNDYINNTRGQDTNYNLAVWYEEKEHFAGAISHYLRSANYGSDPLLQYKAYLRAIFCFQKIGNRTHTVKRMLQSAIAHMPQRKEAYYFLSVVHEQAKEWHDAYQYASIGYDLSPHESLDIKEYPGDWALQFQKGVSAWWVGEYEQARRFMYGLYFKSDVDKAHSEAVIRNISSIGYPQTTYEYNKSKYESVRFKFSGLEKVTQNYAQVYQDLFVLAVLNGKENGYYLEIGSNDPFITNNTALLETVFNWNGISIDISQNDITNFIEKRKNKAVCCDATTVNYEELLKDSPNIIDYLQVDCDPPEATLHALKRIPFDKYKFRVITFEHDDYRSKDIKEASRDFLREQGYQLLVSDIAFYEGCNFEDWWIHPELVDKKVITEMQDISPNIKDGRKYIYLWY
ncbi:hypothetical protein EBZ38_01625 [bacterium]|nr:hypothetical protein [bacterium]